MTEPEVRPILRANVVEQSKQVAEKQYKDTHINGKPKNSQNIFQRTHPGRLEVEVKIFYDLFSFESENTSIESTKDRRKKSTVDQQQTKTLQTLHENPVMSKNTHQHQYESLT